MDLNPLVQKNVRLQGSFSHNYPVWERVIHLLAAGLTKPELDRRPAAALDGWREAFDAMHERRVIKSVLVRRSRVRVQSGATQTRTTTRHIRIRTMHLSMAASPSSPDRPPASGAASPSTSPRSAPAWSSTGARAAARRETLDAIRDGGRPRRRGIAATSRTRRRLPRARRVRRATTFGGLDILVNNAALTTRGDIEDVPLDVVGQHHRREPARAAAAACRPRSRMQARGGGSVVNIGSVNAYIGEPKLCPYSVSKGGLMTLTRNGAAYLNQLPDPRQPDQRRLDADRRRATGSSGRRARATSWLDEPSRTRPFGRLLLPADVANAAAYFASDDSALVTGAVMDLEQYPVGAPPNW